MPTDRATHHRPWRPLGPPPEGRPRPKIRPPMSGAELAMFASLAYGPGWQTALAADLRVSRATVNRWRRGRFRISDDRAMLIEAVCHSHARQKHALVRKAHRRAIRDRIRARQALNRITSL